MLFDNLKREKCLSGIIICAFYCPAYRSSPVYCVVVQASHPQFSNNPTGPRVWQDWFFCAGLPPPVSRHRSPARGPAGPKYRQRRLAEEWLQHHSPEIRSDRAPPASSPAADTRQYPLGHYPLDRSAQPNLSQQSDAFEQPGTPQPVSLSRSASLPWSTARREKPLGGGGVGIALTGALPRRSGRVRSWEDMEGVGSPGSEAGAGRSGGDQGVAVELLADLAASPAGWERSWGGAWGLGVRQMEARKDGMDHLADSPVEGTGRGQGSGSGNSDDDLHINLRSSYLGTVQSD
jgi:hypothetical protein